MGKIFLDLSELSDQRIDFDLERADGKRRGPAAPERKRLRRGEAEFVFRRNEKGKDHVECDSQVLEVGGIPIRSIAIAGGCRWGYYKEDFGLEFTDGRRENFTVCLSDQGFSLNRILEGLSGTDRMIYAGKCRAFDVFDAGEEKRYLFYCKKDLDQPGTLERICFPDNCFMKIFAITLESDEFSDIGE